MDQELLDQLFKEIAAALDNFYRGEKETAGIHSSNILAWMQKHAPQYLVK